MLIVSVRDNGNNTWKRKGKNKDRKEQRGDARYSESLRVKWFCCAFMLSLICKVSLSFYLFKSNLE